jgi:membrane protein
VVAVLLVLALATLYKLALPHKLPWHRGVPGAVLAMVFFLVASIGLRIYLTLIGRTGYTYGALAAPIAFLLFTFFIGLAIVIGAHFNSAIQEMWPARKTRRQRRKWRRLEMVRRAEDSRRSTAEQSWQRDEPPTEAVAEATSAPAAEPPADKAAPDNPAEPADSRDDAPADA